MRTRADGSAISQSRGPLAYQNGTLNRCSKHWRGTTLSKAQGGRAAATSWRARSAASRPMIYSAPPAPPPKWTALRQFRAAQERGVAGAEGSRGCLLGESIVEHIARR